MKPHIVISQDLEQLEAYLNPEKGTYSKIIVLVDENTAIHCWPNLGSACPSLQNAELIEIPAGESSKSIEIAIELWSGLKELGADRSSLLINLGGGVVCDLGGFVASTYMRGIDFIHLPTSLLAQVDAGIGGKNGIDLGHHKNMVGSIELPLVSFIDPSFIETLDRRELLCGFAEMTKHALLAGGDHLKAIQDFDLSSALPNSELIARSANFKSQIVEQDFRESSLRKILNFGHSFGHALESAALSFNMDLLHGEAVALGMLIETELAELKGIGSKSSSKLIWDLIYGHFDPKLPGEISFEIIMDFLRSDKKNKGNELLFVLLEEPGKPLIDITVTEDEAQSAWLSFCAKLSE